MKDLKTESEKPFFKYGGIFGSILISFIRKIEEMARGSPHAHTFFTLKEKCIDYLLSITCG